MIEYKTGDILTEDAEALVNTVNCVGIMGRGVALQVKHAYPDNFKAYEVACKRGDVEPGRMFTFETGWLTNPRLIINFPTKRHWRARSRMEDIDAGLEALAEEIRARHVHSIAIPPPRWSHVGRCATADRAGVGQHRRAQAGHLRAQRDF